MRLRIKAAAVGLLVASALVVAGPAARAIAQTSGPAVKAHAALGPPLGYYFSVVKTCAKNRRKFYHDKAFYRACMQAAVVVRNANRTTFCDFANTFELIPFGLLPPVQIASCRR